MLDNNNQDEKCVCFVEKLTEALRQKTSDPQNTFYDLLHMFETFYQTITNKNLISTLFCMLYEQLD